jgi:hypothetical protein
VLITDGASNSGSAPTIAAEQAQQQGVPLYIWGVGIASPKDVIVANVFAQDVAFVDDELSVAVRVRSSGMEGRNGTLTLKLNDEQVASQDISFTGGEQLVSLTFTPKKPGDFKLTAAIAPADDEVVKDNNAQSQPLRVIDAKIKVLLVEQSPRWEFKYLMALLQRDRRIKLNVVLMEADPQVAGDPKSPYLPRFPTKREELFAYDLVILGDLDPRNLAAGQIEALHEFVSQLGGSLLMIAGHNYRPAPIETRRSRKCCRWSWTRSEAHQPTPAPVTSRSALSSRRPASRACSCAWPTPSRPASESGRSCRRSSGMRPSCAPSPRPRRC